jgi:hypothetical protein
LANNENGEEGDQKKGKGRRSKMKKDEDQEEVKKNQVKEDGDLSKQTVIADNMKSKEVQDDQEPEKEPEEPEECEEHDEKLQRPRSINTPVTNTPQEILDDNGDDMNAEADSEADLTRASTPPSSELPTHTSLDVMIAVIFYLTLNMKTMLTYPNHWVQYVQPPVSILK